MKFLENKLRKFIANSKQKALLEEKLSAGDFEFVFITLLDEKLITYDDYVSFRSEHSKRKGGVRFSLNPPPARSAATSLPHLVLKIGSNLVQ